MRIIQITDLHIGREGEETRDVDVRSNLKRMLAVIPEFQPDLLVITGDICYKEPQEEAFIWLEAELSELKVAALIIPGNHDETYMIPHHFLPTDPDENEERYLTVEHEGDQVTLMFLDTQKGSMGKTQMDAITNYLSDAEKQILIFMHHPPVVTGVGFMDNHHAFQNQEEFQSEILKFGKPTHIFCGHCHVEKTISIKNMHVHITPSNFFQIKQDQDEFEVDHYDIGFRVIDWENGILRHRVEYLPSS